MDAATLDNIESNLRGCCTCEPESGIEPCNWCKTANAFAKLRAELATAISCGEFWARVTRETEDRFADYRKEFPISRAFMGKIAELETDSVRLDTLEKWAERSNETAGGVVVLRIAWPASSTLRETADAIRATMDAANKGGEK